MFDDLETLRKAGGLNLNNYTVTVVTNVDTYIYKNVVAESEKEARNIAESDITWATSDEVLKSNADFEED